MHRDDVSATIEATPCMLKHTHSKASTLLSRHILRCAAAALLLTLAAILCGQQTPFAAAANTTNSATKYEIVVFKDVMVPMRDGVKLACNIYRPALNGKLVEGKFPVILERTPYSKDADEYWTTVFVPLGYVPVRQDVRGRSNSERALRLFS